MTPDLDPKSDAKILQHKSRLRMALIKKKERKRKKREKKKKKVRKEKKKERKKFKSSPLSFRLTPSTPV